MVARLAVVGVALVAVTFPLPQNIQVPLRPGRTPVTWILTRHLCSALVAFRQITGPFLRAHAAHTPHDDQDPPRDSRRHQRGHTPRQGQEEEELLAASSSKATGTHDPSHATEAAAPVPAESTASPTSQPCEPSSQPQRGRSATRRKRGSAAEASEPGQLGVARTVTLAGVGEVTYGELAITQLRRQAAALREEWGNEADFVRQNVGRLIVSQSAPPTQTQVTIWARCARGRFRVRGPARVREAEQLERLASEILATLEKAGAHLRLPGSPSSPRPGTTEQASRTDSDGGASGTARGSPPPPTSTNDYCRTGIQQLRNQAAVMRHTYSSKDAFVARQVAARMARSENLYPPECVVREWRYQATQHFSRRATLRMDEAAALEARATAWENRLTAGALTQDDPCEGTSGVTQPSERAPKPQRTPGRPGDPRRHRQKRQVPVEATSTAASSDPSVSSSPTAAETRGSLAGTLLGSTVELEGIGKVPYVQLAIDALSRRAAYLKSIWESSDQYVRLKIAEQMVQHNVRYPAADQLRTWIRAARKLYDNRKGVRTQEAAELMNLADDLTTRAAAAGIPLRSSQERTAQAAKSGEHLPSAQGEGPSVGPRHSPSTGEPPTTFAHLAIAVLRSEAQFLRSLWYCGEAHAVAQHLALRMVRQGDPSPSPKAQRVWEHTYRAAYHRHVRGRQDHVRQLEARALALEQELQSLLSATRGHEAAPSREAESTGKSSETPKSGKRKAKTKHLSQTPSASAGEGTSSAGEGTSSAGAASMPRSLWLTPVVALPLRAPRQGPWWPGAEAPVAGRQVSPTDEPQPKRARRSRETSGRSPPTASGPSVGTGGQLPAQLGPASAASATPAAESDGGSSETVPAAPKKRMLLQFLATQIAAGTPSPPHPVPTVRPRSPASTASAGPPLAARPHPSLPQPARQAERPGRVSSDREPRALPLKKRPLRTPLPLVHSSPTSTTQHDRGPPVSGAHTTAGTEPSSGVQPPPSGTHI